MTLQPWGLHVDDARSFSSLMSIVQPLPHCHVCITGIMWRQSEDNANYALMIIIFKYADTTRNSFYVGVLRSNEIDIVTEFVVFWKVL